VNAETRARALSPGGWGTVSDAFRHQRYAVALPKRYTRSRCDCGCGGRTTHSGSANGLALTSGCEWSIRQWVRNPDWEDAVPHRIRVAWPDGPPGWLADPPRTDDGQWRVVQDVEQAGEWSGREALRLDIALNDTQVGRYRKAVRARRQRVIPGRDAA